MFAFDAISTQKTCQTIVESGNHYIGALKGNQSGLLSAVQTQFQAQQTVQQMNKGHGRGRIEKRTVSISQTRLGDSRLPWTENLDSSQISTPSPRRR